MAKASTRTSKASPKKGTAVKPEAVASPAPVSAPPEKKTRSTARSGKPAAAKVAAAPAPVQAATTAAPPKPEKSTPRKTKSATKKSTAASKASAASAVSEPVAETSAAPVLQPAIPPEPAASSATVTPEQRYKMVQDAAYYIAERHGFVGDNAGFWLEAERTIDAQLAARHGS